MKCASCGKEIKNAHYINGKAYGIECYKRELAIIYKKWEDEKNRDYSDKCFSAMEIFKGKNSNSFHDSIVNQWNDCKKLTAKQLQCIVKGFTTTELVEFYKVWFNVSDNEEVHRYIINWIYNAIANDKLWYKYINDEIVTQILTSNICGNIYKHGFYFWNDIEIDKDTEIYLTEIGRNERNLLEAQNDEYIKIFKIVK